MRVFILQSKFGQIFDICPDSEFTVKALMMSNFLKFHNFQMKKCMNVKIWLFTKLCTQKKLLVTKMPNFKQQKLPLSYLFS